MNYFPSEEARIIFFKRARALCNPTATTPRDVPSNFAILPRL